MDAGSPVRMLRRTGGSPAPGRHGAAWTAVEQERRRWARELHDETLQNLAGLMIRLSSARRRNSSEVLASAVDETIAGLQQEIANLRSLITDLRPAVLDRGLDVAISALAEGALHNGFEVDVDVDLDGDTARRFELDTAVYRIVQESLTNAQKHGHARRAHVEVRERDELIEISVRDDGVGFEPDARTGGFGLLGMRERVELFGGSLRIESMPGRGARILATLPAREPAALTAIRAGGRAA